METVSWMETFQRVLSPDFVLRNSVYTSVLIGFACPLVGVFLVLRRLVFMGVALPQISSTGVAIAMSVPVWVGAIQPEHAAHKEHVLAFAGSMVFSIGAILLLAFLERRGRGLPEGRLGAAYVVAAALMSSIRLRSLRRATSSAVSSRSGIATPTRCAISRTTSTKLFPCSSMRKPNTSPFF